MATDEDARYEAAVRAMQALQKDVEKHTMNIEIPKISVVSGGRRGRGVQLHRCDSYPIACRLTSPERSCPQSWAAAPRMPRGDDSL
jgi:hypothetical protein